MNVEEILSVDCDKARNRLNIGEIMAINCLVTQPEVFEENFEYKENFREELQDMIDLTSQASDEYSDDHDNDYYEPSQLGTLESFIETEFVYICRDDSDIVNLASALMHRITAGHPFSEGNKRTAYLSACLFMVYHFQEKNLDTAVIPDLDKDLLDSLEDIAIDSKSVSYKELSKVFKSSVEKELEDVI